VIGAFWSTPARQDLEAISDRIAEYDVAIANQVERQIADKAEWLVEHPYTGAPIGVGKLRKSIVVSTSYLIIYRPAGGTIEIARIRHMAEDWQNA
jgi:plasmid stabilization system protein ParE